LSDAAWSGGLQATEALGRLVAVWLLVAGCASRSVELRDSVTLRGAVPEEAVAGETIEAKFTLTNISSAKIELCSADGVSMMIESPSRGRWPMILHGITTDTDCSGPNTLGPGEARTFLERGGIRRDWPAGPSVLVGTLTLWCRQVRRCAGRQLEVRSTIQVRPGPGG
jgi:hypothetical protein